MIDREAAHAADAYSKQDIILAEREQLKVVFLSLSRVVLPGLFGGIFIAGVVINTRPDAWYSQTDVLAWLAFIVILFVDAYRLTRSAEKLLSNGGENQPSLKYLNYQFQVGAAGTGVGWGLCSWLFLPAEPLAMACVFLACAGALFGGAINCLNAPRALVWNILLHAAVFSVGLVYNDQTLTTLGLAIGYIATAVAIYQTASGQSRVVRELHLERISRERLLAEFEEQTKKLHEQQLSTERARHDAEEARRDAERANAAKNAFLAAASHDLRQPMHALMQYFSAIDKLNKDDDLVANIAGAGQSLDAMNDLLNAVLEIGKLMLGSVHPTRSSFALGDWTERLVAQIRPAAQTKGLKLFVKIEQQLHAHTDSLLLERVLRNLLHNAINFTQRGSVTINVARRAGHVRIRVRDTGCGVAKADRTRIFEPFVQVQNPARDSALGLGLGLAIVRELTDLLEIPLRLTSTKSRGSIFTLTFPLVEARSAFSAVELANTDMAPNYVAGAIVVFIDDNDMSLRATEMTLSSFGCTVIAAHTPEAVVELLKSTGLAPQLVISDYRLPQGDGIAAIETVSTYCVNTFGPDFTPASLIISGDTAPDELERVLGMGMTMLHKPIHPHQLFAFINDQLVRSNTSLVQA
jgi:signal transduction histidine kinase/CheY-like chemotaxis protein